MSGWIFLGIWLLCGYLGARMTAVDIGSRNPEIGMMLVFLWLGGFVGLFVGLCLALGSPHAFRKALFIPDGIHFPAWFKPNRWFWRLFLPKG